MIRAMSVSEKLLKNYKGIIDKAAKHPLAKEICDGTLSDRCLYVYLSQDLLFFQSALRFSCRATSLSPDESLLRRAKQIGFFANDENDYFQKCLELVGADLNTKERERYTTTRLPVTDKFIKYMETILNNEKSYSKFVAFGYASELVYLLWPKYFEKRAGIHWKYQRWIDLHQGQQFEDWCQFLTCEIDKCDYEEICNVFKDVIQLEYDFFEACYHC